MGGAYSGSMGSCIPVLTLTTNEKCFDTTATLIYISIASVTLCDGFTNILLSSVVDSLNVFYDVIEISWHTCRADVCIGNILLLMESLSFLFCYQISWNGKGIVTDIITVGTFKRLSNVITMRASYFMPSTL